MMTRKENRTVPARASFHAVILTILAVAVVACWSAAAAAQGSSPWAQQAELLPPDADSIFGESVAIDVNVAVIGARGETVNGNVEQGAAYVFINNGGVWTQQAVLTAADGAAGDEFGFAVSITGSTITVGAPERSVNGVVGGTVYVFENSGGNWTQTAELTTPTAGFFGSSVSVRNDTLVAGAPYALINGQQLGAVYVFVNNGGTWTQQAVLTAADALNDEGFGSSVSVDGTNIVVGAPLKTVNSTVSKGMAYVFTNSGGTWSQSAELTAPDGNMGSGFGTSVSLSGNTAVIGAPNVNGPTPGIGSVYIWQLDSGTWSNSAELTASDSTAGNGFGTSVSLDGTSGRLAVGAPQAGSNPAASGEAYVFAMTGGSWTQQAILTGSDTASGDRHGYAVGISGTTMLVGAWSHGVAANSGAAYVYIDAPKQLQITQEPAVGDVGSAIDPVMVQLEDAAGNALTTSGVAVTLTSNPAGVSGTLTVNTTNGVAEFDGLTFGAANTYTLTASAAGLTSATGDTIQISQLAQKIRAVTLSNHVLGSAFNLRVVASSGLEVTFTSLTPTVCSMTVNTVKALALGLCELEGTQAGNNVYAAATPIYPQFYVTKAQSIPVPTLIDRPAGAAFDLVLTASSGLSVTITSLSPTICSVTGNTVNTLIIGLCQLEANQPGNDEYAPAKPVDSQFQVTPASQTITVPTLISRPVGSAFDLALSASSGLPVTITSVSPSICSVSGNTVKSLALGLCQLEATQAGNDVYAAATPVYPQFQITGKIQTITFPALKDRQIGSSFTLNLAASSGLPATITSLSPSVCSVTGNTITPLSAGVCQLEATQAGNDQYSAATPVDQSFQVLAKKPQTISFPAPPKRYIDAAPFTIRASASSGLEVTLTSLSPSVCSASGTTVRVLSVGTCQLEATQPGNAVFAAATPVDQSFQVTQRSQIIKFPTLANQQIGVGPFPITATATSGLPVTFSSYTQSVCTVTGDVVTVLSIGVCQIEAQQSGNQEYLPATAVMRSFSVTKQDQVVEFPAIANQTLGTAPFQISATASSGLAVVFGSKTSGVCITTRAGVVTLKHVGTCTLQAGQAGNDQYNVAQATQSFQVTQGTQTITFAPIPFQRIKPGIVYRIPLSASATSGLEVVFTSLSPDVCKISTNSIGKPIATLIDQLGTCTIQATQAGNADYSPAPPVTQSFEVVSTLP